MSEDHKPMNDGERKRIINAGGFVSEGRVNGSLALSRALGDFEYKMNKELDEKQQAVTAFPEIREFQLQEGDEFMILACDGIWDVMSSQECVNFVRERLVAKLKSGESDLKLSQICEELCDRCLAPDTRGSGLGCDNMSVVVVPTEEILFDCVSEHRAEGVITRRLLNTVVETIQVLLLPHPLLVSRVQHVDAFSLELVRQSHDEGFVEPRRGALMKKLPMANSLDPISRANRRFSSRVGNG